MSNRRRTAGDVMTRAVAAAARAAGLTEIPPATEQWKPSALPVLVRDRRVIGGPYRRHPAEHGQRSYHLVGRRSGGRRARAVRCRPCGRRSVLVEPIHRTSPLLGPEREAPCNPSASTRQP